MSRAVRKLSLVLLPGSLCDDWLWSQQCAVLSDVCTPRVPHFLEHDGIEAMARAVVECMPERFALCGHALGGRVALEVLRLIPERVAALALVSTTVHPVREGEGARRQTQIDLAARDGMAALARVWLPKVLRPDSLRDEALVRGLTEMYCRFTPDDYRREVSALLNRPDPRPVLPHIACPTLVLSGREDPLCTPEQSRSLAAQIAGAELTILDDCAHFPSIEQPAGVNRALRGWLKGILDSRAAEAEFEGSEPAS